MTPMTRGSIMAIRSEMMGSSPIRPVMGRSIRVIRSEILVSKSSPQWVHIEVHYPRGAAFGHDCDTRGLVLVYFDMVLGHKPLR